MTFYRNKEGFISSIYKLRYPTVCHEDRAILQELCCPSCFVSEQIILSLAFGVIAANAWATWSFKSVSAVTPVFNVTKSGEPLAPGYLFLTTTALPYPAAVKINDDGELVWDSPVGGYSNLYVQTLNKKQVLTYWNGKVDCQADLHESYVTERGSLLVTGYNLTQADLTSVNGSADGWVYDSLFFEFDIKNKEILFQWSALESGIPISNTKQALGSSGTESAPFDFYHINSIQVQPAAILLSRQTSIFAWEHHAHVLNVTHSSVVLHMFDNANSEPPHSGVNQTLGLMFSLDLNKKTSTLLKGLYDSTHSVSNGGFETEASISITTLYVKVAAVTAENIKQNSTAVFVV
ncbi:hypothetical protein OIDMADRAFT_48059 [Oidiodendron maius Zn]|uniref:Uncharacterized protein n=1 Tax=Oidiodendron maius (strain Zn) TaxID=913774 RepID=A0A0C3DA34_OIDMZ|nr:hypothetical protein OIDMADRAFT_48059 [Oidiodendron maius Zn]